MNETGLPELRGYTPYPRSWTEHEENAYALLRDDASGEKWLHVRGDGRGFEGEPAGDRALLCPLTPENASMLRARLPWLKPVTLGLSTSAGCGDRLGTATPGHVRAMREAGGVAPIFAQQSIRENARTGRNPQQVMDAGMWGIFQEGWRRPWGADGDHLKTTADVDQCLAAGYTFFTVDPGDHVDNQGHTDPPNVLADKMQVLPWQALEDTARSLRDRYLGRRFELEDSFLTFDETALMRAVVKYGRAIAHCATMHRHLAALSNAFDLEISVDETETPTSAEEHFFFANELRRLGVKWVSLAPRYVGSFEKGVEYKGDLDEFQRCLVRHAAIARVLGPYKLSIHSGSDKFSLYDAFARETRGLVHLKTAGTNYLEGLRVVATADPALFREILSFAEERYGIERATYHVSARVDGVPEVGDQDLPGLVDQHDARQILHVTFGSVIVRYGPQIAAVLRDHEEAHYTFLAERFVRHLRPFCRD